MAQPREGGENGGPIPIRCESISMQASAQRTQLAMRLSAAARDFQAGGGVRAATNAEVAAVCTSDGVRKGAVRARA